MCGINLSFGIEKLELMNAAISHRGIRSTITHIDPIQGDTMLAPLTLGHVRLPIQGLGEEWDQPFWINEDVCFAFVGEYLNFKDFAPNAESDLPILANRLLREGFHILNEVDGFFSIIAIDKKSKLIHVVTDILAKKPLYLRTDSFGISSEIKALTHIGPVTPDEIYFSAVAKWGYCPEGRTPYKEVVKIPAATHMCFDFQGRPQFSNQWWVPHDIPQQVPLKDKLKKAISNRLVADVPVSVLMSGGLDSTIIYYLMKELTDQPINIFHIDNDESQYLDYIDFRQQDVVKSLDIDSNDYDLDEILWYNDGPVDLGSMVPQFLLAEALKKEGFNVCITGDGADELFGGYKRAMEYDSQHSDIFHELVFYHLPRLDKMSMAHLVELRSPFLAQPILEHALTLPWELRKGKNYLKAAFAGVIPDEILHREKKPLRFRKSPQWTQELITKYRNYCWRSDQQ